MFVRGVLSGLGLSQGCTHWILTVLQARDTKWNERNVVSGYGMIGPQKHKQERT